MSRPLVYIAAAGFFALAILAQPAFAQEDTDSQPRALAPGVLRTVPPSVNVEETFTNYRPLFGLTPRAFTPNEAPITETLASRVEKVIFRHDVFCYEFSYKPLRLIRVDVPQPTGKMQQKVIWYLVYRVRNLGPAASLGNEVVSQANAINQYNVLPKNELDEASLHGRFFPNFVLEGWAATNLGRDYERKEYLDRVIPAAVTKIQSEEDAALTFYNSVEITGVDIPASSRGEENDGVWGVATWEDVDPRIDYASVYVQGLSNAFKVVESADAEPKYTKKTLQLNFWRPGDTLDETRDDIRVGVPIVDSMREQVDITARYELPGPVVIASRFDPVTNRNERLFVLDGMLNEDLDSRLQIQMQGGDVPGAIVNAFAEVGIEVPATVALNETVRNRQWQFTADVDGETQSFRLRFTPLLWEKVGRRIRYLDRLDYLWIYR